MLGTGMTLHQGSAWSFLVWLPSHGRLVPAQHSKLGETNVNLLPH
jgi:hypothetical protein